MAEHPSEYPGAIDSYDQKFNHADDYNQSEDINAMQYAVVAIETELGTDPAGSEATVADRLDAMDTTDAAKASKALDNLASTAVNVDILPDTDVTHSLGSAAKKWLAAWIAKLVFPEIASPSNPASGYHLVYFKADGKLYTKDSAGTETEVGSGGGGGLTYSAIAPTTANITLTEQYSYGVDESGLTANRNLVLPAPSDAGKKIEVSIKTGNSTYACIIIGDTGVTINGGSAATEWSRLFCTNESITLLSTSTSNWMIIVNHQKQSKASIIRNAAQSIANGGSGDQVQFDTTEFDTCNMVTLVTYRITVRRANTYKISARGIFDTMPDASRTRIVIQKNGSTISQNSSWNSTSGAGYAKDITEAELVAGDYITMIIYQNSGAANNTSVYDGAEPQLSLREIIN
jgi:hypothetical protein